VGTGRLEGETIRANYYLETLEPREFKQVLKYRDEVAGIVNSVGKATAWLLRSFVGHSGTASYDEGVSRFIARLMDECGVRSERRGRLLMRKKVGRNREACLLANPTSDEVWETIDAASYGKVTDLLDVPLEQACDAVAVTVKPLGVRALILEK
jgi:hypothetical protein